MAVVVEAFDRGVLNGAVNPLDLSVGTGVVGLGQPTLDAMLATDLVEAMDPEERRPTVPVLGQVGELGAVVGHDRVQTIGDGFEQGFQEGDGGRLICLLVQGCERELRGPVDGDEQMELALGRADLGNVDVDEADRIGLERTLGRGPAFDLGQAGDTVALQTSVLGRARQVRERGLQGVEAIVERQQRMPPEGGDRFFLNRRAR